jgi:hypothetical protein
VVQLLYCSTALFLLALKKRLKVESSEWTAMERFFRLLEPMAVNMAFCSYQLLYRSIVPLLYFSGYSPEKSG